MGGWVPLSCHAIGQGVAGVDVPFPSLCVVLLRLAAFGGWYVCKCVCFSSGSDFLFRFVACAYT